jgi:SAM-dependent methyltransferase
MRIQAAVLCLFAAVAVRLPVWSEPLLVPDEERFSLEDAERMIGAAKGHLAPVYAPLAKQVVADFGLAEKEGVGIDLGGGPGTLILELCKRTTNLHWVNADVNPHFFPPFFEEAAKAGMGGRVSAVFADAHLLPFRDGYADTIVSRGCFFFWEDKPRAFAEVYRVLRPGGVAYVGRGMARDFPLETAREIRSKQKGNKTLAYDPEETAKELREDLRDAGIADFEIECPKPEDAGNVHYGVWVTVRKSQE